MAISISMKEMLENGVHFGHKASRWNPKMKKNIFGKRSGIHIIDLEKTVDHFVKALDFIHSVASEGKTILFVATKSTAANIVSEYAEASKSPFVINRWLGGTLTNYTTIRERIRGFKKLEESIEAGEMDHYTKKERVLMHRELASLRETFQGLREMTTIPDVLFVSDISQDKIAITEARKLGIPIVGFADTNADPTLVDYPIPANDDAAKSLRYMLGIINEVIIDGRNNPVVKKEEPKVAPKNEDNLEITAEVIAEKEAATQRAPKKKTAE